MTMTTTTTTTTHYQGLTDDLALWTSESAVHVYLESGLSRTELVAAIASVLTFGNAAATNLAALFVRTLLERSLRRPTTLAAPPLPRDATARLSRAVTTIFADDTAPVVPRIERLARSEVLDTGQQATVEIVNQIPEVQGWTRVLDGDPCGRCIGWAEGGRVFPRGHHFKRHFGCNCQMNIVVRKG